MRRARDFSHLRGGLLGISDRALDQHLVLYGRAIERLNALETTYPVDGETEGETDGGQAVRDLLATPVRTLSLDAHAPIGPMRDALKLVRLEFQAVKPAPMFWPNWYYGTEDFWTTDQGVSINIPWYLGTPQLWALSGRTPDFNWAFDQVLRCLRHELGHAVFFAYGLGALPAWREAFGDCTLPYPQSDERLAVLPNSRAYVEYLTYAPDHYAQKHPEEAWAEAFGRWLDSGPGDWRAEYAAWPEALAKLEAVDQIMRGLRGVAPKAPVYLGRPDPHTTLRGTVGDRLGAPRALLPGAVLGWSEHAEVLRQMPAALNNVVLHELYFDQFAVDQGPADLVPPDLVQMAVSRGWAAFSRDLRTACAATNGWALVVWDAAAGHPRINLVTTPEQGPMVGCPVLLAIDCCEHAYFSDYGARKDLYLGAIFEGLNWATVAKRLSRYIAGA